MRYKIIRSVRPRLPEEGSQHRGGRSMSGRVGSVPCPTRVLAGVVSTRNGQLLLTDQSAIEGDGAVRGWAPDLLARSIPVVGKPWRHLAGEPEVGEWHPMSLLVRSDTEELDRHPVYVTRDEHGDVVKIEIDMAPGALADVPPDEWPIKLSSPEPEDTTWEGLTEAGSAAFVAGDYWAALSLFERAQLDPAAGPGPSFGAVHVYWVLGHHDQACGALRALAEADSLPGRGQWSEDGPLRFDIFGLYAPRDVAKLVTRDEALIDAEPMRYDRFVVLAFVKAGGLGEGADAREWLDIATAMRPDDTLAQALGEALWV